MIGAGKNRKSMAYIGNVVAFLEKCIESDRKYAVFNYVDTPDLDMNTLVRQVRKVLKGQDSVGLRIPQLIGVILGVCCRWLREPHREKIAAELYTCEKSFAHQPYLDQQKKS